MLIQVESFTAQLILVLLFSDSRSLSQVTSNPVISSRPPISFESSSSVEQNSLSTLSKFGEALQAPAHQSRYSELVPPPFCSRPLPHFGTASRPRSTQAMTPIFSILSLALLTLLSSSPFNYAAALPVLPVIPPHPSIPSLPDLVPRTPNLSSQQHTLQTSNPLALAQDQKLCGLPLIWLYPCTWTSNPSISRLQKLGPVIFVKYVIDIPGILLDSVLIPFTPLERRDRKKGKNERRHAAPTKRQNLKNCPLRKMPKPGFIWVWCPSMCVWQPLICLDLGAGKSGSVGAGNGMMGVNGTAGSFGLRRSVVGDAMDGGLHSDPVTVTGTEDAVLSTRALSFAPLTSAAAMPSSSIRELGAWEGHAVKREAERKSISKQRDGVDEPDIASLKHENCMYGRDLKYHQSSSSRLAVPSLFRLPRLVLTFLGQIPRALSDAALSHDLTNTKAEKRDLVCKGGGNEPFHNCQESGSSSLRVPRVFTLPAMFSKAVKAIPLSHPVLAARTASATSYNIIAKLQAYTKLFKRGNENLERRKKCSDNERQHPGCEVFFPRRLPLSLHHAFSDYPSSFIPSSLPSQTLSRFLYQEQSPIQSRTRILI
ncbi:hypothetical protein BKA64DRAFT_300135 [Cadophora sp. MPI-SDFR-AT-0126]|nr:hypothetical protein BKA64DRAFT_300135 [Leotiomycetes sp. MPI-SDFR-AT-0126]